MAASCLTPLEMLDAHNSSQLGSSRKAEQGMLVR